MFVNITREFPNLVLFDKKCRKNVVKVCQFEPNFCRIGQYLKDLSNWSKDLCQVWPKFKDFVKFVKLGDRVRVTYNHII